MPIEILMPALSPTMTEGNLSKWHVKEGDEVNSGDVIAEIETDKATMEVEAVEEGTIGKILIDEGSEGVPVNTLIALLLEEGEDAASLDAAAEPAAKPAPAPTAPPPATPAQATPPAKTESAATSGPNGASSEGRIFVSPLAKRMAKQAGLDLASVMGSGPHGRIIKADVEGPGEKGKETPQMSLEFGGKDSPVDYGGNPVVDPAFQKIYQARVGEFSVPRRKDKADRCRFAF